jgi:hypothetical protein
MNPKFKESGAAERLYPDTRVPGYDPGDENVVGVETGLER